MLDISNAERAIMQVIWQRSPCTAAEIVQQLQQQKDGHEKTVNTLLNRLVSKGALAYETRGRAYLYSPLIANMGFSTRLRP